MDIEHCVWTADGRGRDTGDGVSDRVRCLTETQERTVGVCEEDVRFRLGVCPPRYGRYGVFPFNSVR